MKITLPLTHIIGPQAHIHPLPQKPLDLPMPLTKAFVKDMRAFHAEQSQIRRDEIAFRQLKALRRRSRPLLTRQIV
jgi:hypothetical protein